MTDILYLTHVDLDLLHINIFHDKCLNIECPCVHKKLRFYLPHLDSLHSYQKTLKKICIPRTYWISITHNGECVHSDQHTKASLNTSVSTECADYNVLISVIVLGAKWVSSG